MDELERGWAWLSGVEGVGLKSFYRLIDVYGDPWTVRENVGDADMRFLGEQTLGKLRAACEDEYIDAFFARAEQAGMKILTRMTEGYPESLDDLMYPPPALYVLGDAPLSPERGIAVVGSRRCTRDGERAARELSQALSREGVTVVSGMARGIDAAAHEGALTGGGRTVAVLGCGADVVYPKENADLYRRILESGGAVISEYVPGTQPRPGNFPPRNRIISGLTRGTLIVEAAERSGAMITVNDALEQGRDVFAVPGSIYSPLSAAPNRLLTQGAIPVICGWDILEHYRWAERPEAHKAEKKAGPKLDAEEERIVRPLLEQELSFDELVNLTDLPAAKLNSHLTMLELRGIIVKVPGGQYRAYI